MNRVFADAFFYLALLNADDAAHQRALGAVSAGARQVFTTSAILLEVADGSAAPSSRNACAEWLRSLEAQAKTRVIRVDDALFERGLRLYETRRDKSGH